MGDSHPQRLEARRELVRLENGFELPRQPCGDLSRQKVSLSISLQMACPPLKACRRANSSNQPRRWHWHAGCGARLLLGH